MTFLGIFTSGISNYVRANREEPLMFNAIVTALIVFLSSYSIIQNSTLEKYVMFSSISILIIELPWFLFIFLKYKNDIYKLK